VLQNRHQAVSQGVRRFGKRSIFEDISAFTKAAPRRITAAGAVFQNPAKRGWTAYGINGLQPNYTGDAI
jgi:hypothetical protein